MRTVLSSRQEHARYCWQHDGGWLGDMKDVYGFEGQVRRCVHGIIMVGRIRPGLCLAQWYDLSSIFHPIQYVRALRILSDPDYRLTKTTDFEPPNMAFDKFDKEEA